MCEYAECTKAACAIAHVLLADPEIRTPENCLFVCRGHHNTVDLCRYETKRHHRAHTANGQLALWPKLAVSFQGPESLLLRLALAHIGRVADTKKGQDPTGQLADIRRLCTEYAR